MLYRMAFQLTGNAEDAEDAVQDAFVAVWNQRERLGFLTAEQGRSYFCQTVRHTCLNKLRKHRELPLENETDDGWKRVLPDSAPPPDERLATLDELEQLYAATGKLPAKQAEVFRLYHFEEMEAEEVANRMGESEAYVRLLLSRARRKIKDFFHKNNP